MGVDLGATWVRVVLSNEKGVFLEKMTEHLDTSNPTAISSQIVRLASLLCAKHDLRVNAVKGVGIASAGPMVQEDGVLVKPPNIPFDYVPLSEPISRELGVPVYLINDCAGSVLGERTFGAAKGLDNCVYITISTGIGGGAIVNGTLLLGKDGNSHEIGHFVIDCEGRLMCGCGRRGHWEAYCSGRNIPNYVRMRVKDLPEKTVKESLLFRRMGGDMSKVTAADLFNTAKEADHLSVKLVNEVGVLNAMGFANVINAYDPSLITVGGTVTLKNKRLVLSPIKKHVKDYAINRVPKIIVTPLGGEIGLYGAVAAALKYLQ